MDKDFNRTFTQCPCCGSESRFFEQLGQEMKDRGLTRKDWNYCYDMRQGVVLDQVKEPAIPIGSELPTFGIKTDVCMDCGCMYAVDLKRGNIKKPAPVAVPNRAQRRRIGREGDGGGLVIPGG